MPESCGICGGTGKLEDESGDDVLSMRVCGNCGGTGEEAKLMSEWERKATEIKARFPATPEADVEKMGVREMRYALARAPERADRVEYDPNFDRLIFFAGDARLIGMQVGVAESRR